MPGKSCWIRQKYVVKKQSEITKWNPRLTRATFSSVAHWHLPSKLQNTANTMGCECLNKKGPFKGVASRNCSLADGTGLPTVNVNPGLIMHGLLIIGVYTPKGSQGSQYDNQMVTPQFNSPLTPSATAVPQRSKVLAPPASPRNVPLQPSFHVGSVAVKIGGPFRRHPATLDDDGL